MVEFCECGTMLTAGVCLNKNCAKSGKPAKEFIIDGNLVKFSESVTRAEAEAAYREKSELIVKPKKASNPVAFSEPWKRLEGWKV